MKLANTILLSLAVVSAFAAQAAAPKKLWTLNKDLDAPESAVYDPATDRIYVASVAGDGSAKDGKGWITSVKTNGSVDKAKFVDGLNAPKGVFVHKGTLWTADIDEVVAIDIATAKVKKRYKAAGAKLLNDVVVSKEGTVYVSDLFGSKVYVVKGNAAVVFVEGKDLTSPNGLVISGGKLWVASWGKDMKTDFSVTAPGSIYSIDLKTKKVTPGATGIGNLDGLARQGTNWLASDWMKGTIFTWTGKGAPKTLMTSAKGSADISYVAAKKMLLIPEMLSSSLVAYEIK